MEIKKNNVSFNVKGGYSEKWFSSSHFQKWEKNTFHILDHYYNLHKIYIDIGAWIGPTALYASQRFNSVYAIEPDGIAFRRLANNLKANNIDNITIVNKCLSDKDETILFGGNGKWGNSESTMLVSNPEYSSWDGRWSKEEREKNIKEIETISIDTLITEFNINPSNIGFIKMDIEGGELIVVPAIQHILKQSKPIFYISLHFCFLKMEHIITILDILFDIYDDCYYFNNDGSKYRIEKSLIIADKITSIVFE